jgi:ABC-type tungstate transport system permease subunit
VVIYLSEMEKFLNTYNILNLNQEKEENLNTVIMSNVTESEMKHLTTRKLQEPKINTELHYTFNE